MLSLRFASTALYQTLGAVTGALFVPLVISRCGMADFAMVALFHSCTTLQWPLFDLGLDQYGALTLPQQQGQARNKLEGQFWTIRTTASGFLGVVSIVACVIAPSGSLVSVFLPRLWCYGALCALFPSWHFTASLQPQRLALGNTLARMGTLLVYWYIPSSAWLWAIDVQLLGCLLYAGYGLSLGRTTLRLHKSGLLDLLRKSWPHALQQHLPSAIPQLLLLQMGALWGIASLGVYGLVDRLLRLVLQLQQPILHTILALTASRPSTKIRALLTTWGAIITLVMVAAAPVGLSLITNAPVSRYLWPCLAVGCIPALEAVNQCTGLSTIGVWSTLRCQGVGALTGVVWMLASYQMGYPIEAGCIAACLSSLTAWGFLRRLRSRSSEARGEVS